MAGNGIILMVITAVFFGLSAPAAKIAFNEGASPVILLAVRFSAAALVLWIYRLTQRKKSKVAVSKKQLLLLFLTGGILYFATTILYFNAIIYIPVSLHVIVFNIYPFLINIFSFAILKERIFLNQVFALLVGFLGTILMVWAPGIYINWFGVLLSFLAAFGNSSYVLMVGSRAIEKLDSITVTTYIATFAAVSFIASGLVTGQLSVHISFKGLLAILFIAIFSTVVATITLSLGIKKIGASRASVISTLEPVAGALTGILFMNEKFTPLQVIGAVFIISAVALVGLKKQSTSPDVSVLSQ